MPRPAAELTKSLLPVAWAQITPVSYRASRQIKKETMPPTTK